MTVRMLMTPELARIWLLAHPPGSVIDWPKIAQIAGDIRAGRWDAEQGHPVQFTHGGMINKGLHRLHAVAESGIAVVMRVENPGLAPPVPASPPLADGQVVLLSPDGIPVQAAHLLEAIAYGMRPPAWLHVIWHRLASPAFMFISQATAADWIMLPGASPRGPHRAAAMAAAAVLPIGPADALAAFGGPAVPADAAAAAEQLTIGRS